METHYHDNDLFQDKEADLDSWSENEVKFIGIRNTYLKHASYLWKIKFETN